MTTDRQLDAVRDMMAASPVGMALLDRDGRYLFINDRLAAMNGRPAAEHLGRTPREIVGDAAPPIEAVIAQVLEQGAASVEGEYRGEIPPGSGALRWLKGIFHPVHGPDGGVRAIGAVVLDVTEVHDSIEALRLSEARFRLVAAATQDVIYDYDVAAGRIEWNEATQKVFRYPAGEAEAAGTSLERWHAGIHPDDRPRVAASLAAGLAGAADAWTEEYRFRRGDGTYATVLDRAAIQRDAEGRAVRMIGSMVDLGERHEVEEQRRQAQKMEAMGRLAGGVAHDFNNLLTTITVNLRFLADALEPGHPAREEVEEIRAAADRAARLTRQLLAFSRKQVLQPRLIDLNEIVRSVGRLLARVIGEHIALELDLAPSLHPVLADPGQFEQVLMNLAVNARDAMPGGGTLRIATADVAHGGAAGRTGPIPAGDYVALTVVDSGSGMSETTRLRIFEPFYTTKPPGKGTGLGLSTIYGIVRQSGGHITVDSTPGRGTSFTILLPRARGAPPAPAGATANPAAADWSGQGTVLLVEDQAPLRSSLRRLLERHGYRVLEAQHGADAVALLERAERVDLVVTDVVMPEMGGRELAGRLEAREDAPPILFMSGYDERAVRADQSLPRGTVLLAKPFEPEELMRRVREAMEGRREVSSEQ